MILQKILDVIIAIFKWPHKKSEKAIPSIETPEKGMDTIVVDLEPEPEIDPEPEPEVKGNTMELEVLRFSSQSESTLGILNRVDDDGKTFLCFTLEDEYRTKKKYGETRIPAGRYQIKLRTVGGFHEKYLEKFGADFHKGMLWLQDVPNFEYVLIHIGNRDTDTAACLLVGNTAQQNITEEGYIGASTDAYKRIYLPIANAILSGEEIWITYVDYDKV